MNNVNCMRDISPIIFSSIIKQPPLFKRIFHSKIVHQAILFSIILASNLISPEVISIIMLFLVIMAPITFGMKIPRGIWRVIWPITIMILLGFIGSINNDIDHVIKDFWYFGKLILVIIFGYLAMWKINDIKAVLRIFVLSGFILSIYYLIKLGIDFYLFNEPIQIIQKKIGSGYFISVIAMAILFGYLKYNFNLFQFRTLSYVILMVCFMSIILSFSRTLWLTLLIIILISKKIKILNIIGLLILLVFFIGTGITTNLGNLEGEFGAMIAKISRSINEIMIIDYSDMERINIYWRSVETYQGLKTYTSGSLLELFFGQGFGSHINLEFFMTLQGIMMQHIPIIHNGYVYILVKTGLIGLVLYLYYLVSLFKSGQRALRINQVDIQLVGILLMELSVIFFFTTYFITGLFNKSVLFPAKLLLGILLYYLKNRGKYSL